MNMQELKARLVKNIDSMSSNVAVLAVNSSTCGNPAERRKMMDDATRLMGKKQAYMEILKTIEQNES